jgi:hypothetical protein
MAVIRRTMPCVGDAAVWARARRGCRGLNMRDDKIESPKPVFLADGLDGGDTADAVADGIDELGGVFHQVAFVNAGAGAF